MNTKNYYYGENTGEVVCADCAGRQMQMSMATNPNAKEYQGAQDTYYLAKGDEVTLLREMLGTNALCYCDNK